MVATMMERFLEPVLKVNEEYVAPLNADLEEIDAGFQAIGGIAERAARVLDAVRADDIPRAVREVLEHLEVDDDLEELRAIKTRADQGELLEAAIQAVEAPKLLREILESSRRVVAEAVAQVEELLRSLETVARDIAGKLAGVRQAWGDWSWPERLGTPRALRGVRDRAKAAAESGNAAKEKLDALTKAVDELRQAGS